MAVITTDLAAVTVEVAIWNLADEAPCGTLTPCGTVATLFELVSWQKIPPDGATPFKLIVPRATFPPETEIGLTVSVVMFAGATVIVAVIC